MTPEFFAAYEKQRNLNQPFSIATVIRVIGSASACTGSKAIFDSLGENVYGWVGGGCAEKFVGDQSVEALTDANTRIVLANLDDEIFGLGIACGGQMEVFIEPFYPNETIDLPHLTKFKEIAAHFAKTWQLQVNWIDEEFKPESLDDIFILIAQALSKVRGLSGHSLRTMKDLPVRFRECALPIHKDILLIGKSRITESLSKFFVQLNWNVRLIAPSIEGMNLPFQVHCDCEWDFANLSIKPGSVVVVASHHSQDPELVMQALLQGASHVSMLGSRKRALEVLSKMQILEGAEITTPLFVPAGLDLGARNPDEVALSLTAEILMRRRRNAGL